MAQAAHLNSFQVFSPALLDPGVTVDVAMFQLTCLVTSLFTTSYSYFINDSSNPEGICGCLQKSLWFTCSNNIRFFRKHLFCLGPPPGCFKPFLPWPELKPLTQLHSYKKCKGKRKETKTLLCLHGIRSGTRYSRI